MATTTTSASLLSSITHSDALVKMRRKVLNRKLSRSSNKKRSSRALIIDGLGPYIKNISTFLANILSALDAVFGSLLYSTQTKPLSGMFYFGLV